MKKDFLFPHAWRVPGWILTALFGAAGLAWSIDFVVWYTPDGKMQQVSDLLGGWIDEVIVIGLMAGETGGPEDRYLMFKAVERELKEMKNSIKVQRAMHDMTQQELADRVGVSRQTINAVELGKYVPSAVLAMKVAAAFGRRVEEVFTLEEED